MGSAGARRWRRAPVDPGAACQVPARGRGGRAARRGRAQPYWEDCDAEVVAACEAALAAAGWAVREVELPGAVYAPTAGIVRGLAELGAAIRPEVLADASPLVRAQVLYSRLLPMALLVRADRVRALLRRGLADIFARVDLLAWPTIPAPPCQLDTLVVALPSGTVPADVANVRQAVLANLAGVPGISVPVRPHPSGLPVGLQLLAPWGGEARLLDAAEHLERTTQRAYVDAQPPTAT